MANLQKGAMLIAISIKGHIMKLVEAAELQVEIFKECPKLEGSTSILMPPRPIVNMAQGYKKHVEGDSGIDKETRACIDRILSKHGLTLTADKKGMMIYRKHEVHC